MFIDWVSQCTSAEGSKGHGCSDAVGVGADSRILPGGNLAKHAQSRSAVRSCRQGAAAPGTVAPDGGSRGAGVKIVVQLVYAAFHYSRRVAIALARA